MANLKIIYVADLLTKDLLTQCIYIKCVHLSIEPVLTYAMDSVHQDMYLPLVLGLFFFFW